MFGTNPTEMRPSRQTRSSQRVNFHIEIETDIAPPSNNTQRAGRCILSQMAEWRDRGYVPDSDEEDDLEAQGTRQITVQTSSKAAEYDHPNAQNDENGKSRLDISNDTHRDQCQTVPKELGPCSEPNIQGVHPATSQPALEDSSHSRSALQSTDVLAAETYEPLAEDVSQVERSGSTPAQADTELALGRLTSDYLPFPRPDKDRKSNEANQSPSSSPLSSFTSSPISPLKATESHAIREHEVNIPQNTALEDFPEDLFDLTEEARQVRRSLRQRNPIQIHPYALEDARYQQSLKARGLRPLRLTQSQYGRSSTDIDAQEQGYNLRNESLPSRPQAEFLDPPSSPPGWQAQRDVSTPRWCPSQTSRIDFQSDGLDEFPAVESLLHARDNTKEMHVQKRRKLTHLGKHRTYTNKGITDFSDEGIKEDDVRQNHTMSDVPPSPPLSGNPVPYQVTQSPGGFRFPRGMTPAKPLTPVTSSDLQPRKSAGQEPYGCSIPISESDTEAEDSRAATPAPPDHDVRRLKQKIKGVLPASWLKLDLKAQREVTDTTTHRRRSSPSPAKAQVTKGVAQRISKSRGTSMEPTATQDTAIVISDDSASERESLPEKTISRREQTRITDFRKALQGQEDIDDVTEDNRIDLMLPATSRQTYKGNRNNHRHTRLDAHAEPGKPQPSKLSSSSSLQSKRERQARITEHMPRKKKRGPTKPKPTKLGILDSPDMSQLPLRRQPQFLRVAARQARSKPGKGRQSPSRKFLRLGTRADTEEANDVLRGWQNGTWPERNLHVGSKWQTSRLRESLTERNLNQQGPSEPLSRIAEQSAAKSVTEACVQVPPKPYNDQAVGKSSNVPTTHRATTQKSEAVAKDRVVRSLPQPAKKSIKKSGFLASSFRTVNAPRMAQLESIGKGRKRQQPVSSFHHSLSAINRAESRFFTTSSTSLNLPLARFLAGNDLTDTELTSRPISHGEQPPERNPSQELSRKPRKRPPRRVNAEAVDHRQPAQSSVQSVESDLQVIEDDLEQVNLGGIGSYGTRYTIDFDTVPLQMGTFYHESTLIGCGDFARSLDVISRDWDKQTGHSVLHLNGKRFRWGPWNDAVSTEVGVVFDLVSELIMGNQGRNPVNDVVSDTSTSLKPPTLLRAVIVYINEHLCFIDPIDRLSFTNKLLILVQGLALQIDAARDFRASHRKDFLLTIATCNVILANQICQVASHELVQSSKLADTNSLLQATIQSLLAYVLCDDGLNAVRNFLEENKHHEKREAGIRDDNAYVDAVVVVNHISQISKTHEKPAFWDLVTPLLLSSHSPNLEDLRDAPELEKIWYNVFSLLPLQEIDRYGIAQVGARFKQSCENWPMIKLLVGRVLRIYMANPGKQSAAFNSYCRSLFHRCFQLVNHWGWRNCKLIIDTLFDFFARNGLAHLRHEESHGSPGFLEALGKDVLLEVEPGDRCFHIFLKIIGSGFRHMAKAYDKKKIRNFAWRLMPNHGRLHPKEKPIRREDLDALRNHHDLLCTLYWACPEGCRPRADMIRNLVHPGTSHREACSLSIQAWSRLVCLQLSTDEPTSTLDPFAEWYDDFVAQVLKQHALARTEVEIDVLGANVSSTLVESTISRNQGQVEALLSGALISLKRAIDSAKTMDQPRTLLTKASIPSLFNLFDPRAARGNAVVAQSLDVVQSYVDSWKRSESSGIQVEVSDDSQEYGDLTAFEDVCINAASQRSIEHLYNVIHDPLSRLLSNCFGADTMPNDTILLKLIDCWTSVAQAMIKQGSKQWSNYFSPYDRESWTSLRTTEQTRKFTAYFLASSIGKDSQCYQENQSFIMSAWISSLVERESMLKYQHQLTNALLNVDPQNPILTNLAFSMDNNICRYNISMEDFRQRRLSLISSLLSNMRLALHEFNDVGSSRHHELREEYGEYCKHLMTAMRSNYEELRATPSGSGAYVDFVHRVVEFLQQYTADICQVDIFFTDSTSFPLPAADPAYVIGRLKSYGLRLGEPRVPKQLVVFVQNVVERAAIDGQQDYLVGQLHAAISGAWEDGRTEQATLRTFLLQSVFPAYCGLAFTPQAGWIFAKPILQSAKRVFDDLLFDINSTENTCVQNIVVMTLELFGACRHAIVLLTDEQGIFEQPAVLSTLEAMLSMITSSLRVIDFIERVAHQAQDAIAHISYFKQFALFTAASLLGQSDIAPSSSSPPEICPSSSLFQVAKTFAAQELRASLNSWTCHDHRYYVLRGNLRKEVFVPLMSMEEEKAGLLRVIENFFAVMDGLESFCEGQYQAQSSEAYSLGWPESS